MPNVLNVKFETLTYAAASPEDLGGGAWSPQLASLTSPQGEGSPTLMPDGLAGFLWRVAAYFHGYLSSLPRFDLAHFDLAGLSLARRQHPNLIVIDSANDESCEPLIMVTLNRALSRRMRWLVRRGRIDRTGRMRIATAEDKARCNLTPGQFIEYSIRVHRQSRPRSYSLGLTRLALRLIAISAPILQGNVVSLQKPASCAAPLSPD